MDKLDKKFIESDYFRWLCNMAGINDDDGHNYWLLAGTLHQIEFTYSVPNDKNRAEDGIYLRRLFTNYYEIMNKPCSVFEMLVGVASRMDDILHIPNGEDMTDVWFKELLQNLGLASFTDDKYAPSSTYSIYIIVRNLINRKYCRSGKGGMFPLKKSRQDQRKAEIWYQMSAYINEKYPIS